MSTNVTFAKRKSRRVSLTPIDATPLQVWPGEESGRATQLMPVKQELLLMSYRSNHGPVRLDFILCSVQIGLKYPLPRLSEVPSNCDNVTVHNGYSFHGGTHCLGLEDNLRVGLL